MEETSKMRGSARLEQLEKEIVELQTLIGIMKMVPPPETQAGIMDAAAKHKELGFKIEEREVILEKRRVAEVVESFEQEHPQEFDPCPLCLENVISIHDVFAAVLLTCCGKNICTSCYEEQREKCVSITECPLCHAPTPDTDQEADEAVQLLAETGNVWAEHDIAQRYLCKAAAATSEESRRDLDQKALVWYRRAAEKGCASAELNIACRYLGNGQFWAFSEGDPREGLRWMEAAANHGHPSAKEGLGLIYYDDYNDKERAMFWLSLAAEHRKPKSLLHLGIGFAHGLGGLDKNLERAKYYLESKELSSLSAEELGWAQYTLSGVLIQLAEKRYGHTPLHWVPCHNCIFDVVSLLRKAVENGYDKAKDLLERWEGDQKVCFNCWKSQDELPSPLLRCTQCKLVRYCGQACQKKHWKMGHKIECQKFCSGET